MTSNRPIETYPMDMDGVLVHQEQLIPGADQFVKRLEETGHRFLVLTNNSIYTPRDLAARLRLTGLEVPEEAIWTSALATARFLDQQRPGGTAYVIGEAGLTTALHERGYVLSEREPDYVVLGETRSYSLDAVTRAIRLIAAGARFIATNPDPTGPSPAGPQPATGAVAALISKATGVDPYFVGKPNPLMMREALRAIDAHSESTVMIGDRMDTDIVAGMEAGLATVLVLSLLCYAVVDFAMHEEVYAVDPPLVLFAVAGAIAVLASMLWLVSAGVPRAETLGLSLLLGAAAAAALYPGLLRVNEATDDEGLRAYEYRLTEYVVFSPMDPNLPVLEFPGVADYWRQFKLGTMHSFELRKGALGFYQVNMEPVHARMREYSAERK